MTKRLIKIPLLSPVANTSGFSIVQALIGVGITAIMAMVGAQTMSSLSQSARKIDSKGVTNSANQSLQVYLAYENICTPALRPTVVNSTKEVPLSFDIPGLGKFAGGEKNTTLDIEIESLTVNDLLLSETNSLGMKIYLGLLKSAYSRSNGDHATHFRSSPVGTLSLMTTASGRVVKCSLGKVAFNSVPQTNPAAPSVPVVGTPGNPVTEPSYPPVAKVSPGSGAKTCSTVEQCAVYDYFLRNGISNPYASADQWMSETAAWSSIARSYIDSMSALGKINFLASVNQAGLVQTGRQGAAGNAKRPDTIDQWVAEAVALDPSGRTMLTTSEGINTLKSMFDVGSTTSTTTQDILRAALTKSADLTMNSSLGIGAWVDALGYANATEMAKSMPAAAVNAAMSPGAGKDPAALKAVVDYINANPAESVKIANGTGIWAKNVSGNVNTVMQYISANLAASGNNELAISIAKATDQWAGVIGSDSVGRAIASNSSGSHGVAAGTATWNGVVGTAAVTNAIKNNSAAAANIAAGTAAATSIFGEAAVKTAISDDAAAAAKGATAINAAKEAGYSDAEIKAYIEANPTTWQNWSK